MSGLGCRLVCGLAIKQRTREAYGVFSEVCQARTLYRLSGKGLVARSNKWGLSKNTILDCMGFGDLLRVLSVFCHK
jgi:hypothetical protein